MGFSSSLTDTMLPDIPVPNFPCWKAVKYSSIIICPIRKKIILGKWPVQEFESLSPSSRDETHISPQFGGAITRPFLILGVSMETIHF